MVSSHCHAHAQRVEATDDVIQLLIECVGFRLARCVTMLESVVGGHEIHRGLWRC